MMAMGQEMMDTSSYTISYSIPNFMESSGDLVIKEEPAYLPEEASLDIDEQLNDEVNLNDLQEPPNNFQSILDEDNASDHADETISAPNSPGLTYVRVIKIDFSLS